MAVASPDAVGWERWWREGVHTAVQRIIEEEADAAAERVKDRTKELGAQLALKLSKHADIRRMEDRLVISIHMEGLEPQPLSAKERTQLSNLRGLEVEEPHESEGEQRRTPRGDRQPWRG